MTEKLNCLITEICKEIEAMGEIDDKIEALNGIKQQLHKVSPLSGEPVDCVLWVKSDKITANDYNPNKVAPPEMRLLYDSIKNDGYTQPIVTGTPSDQEGTGAEYIVTDGYHRHIIPRHHKDIEKRLHGYLPVTVLKGKTQSELMASTIRHNRARGCHDVDLMSQIIKNLDNNQVGDAWIATHLGMDLDEILRLKQLTGLVAMFKDSDFGKAWEVIDHG